MNSFHGNIKISKLETIDIKTVWPNEAKDFTPWLANADEDNIAKLNE